MSYGIFDPYTGPSYFYIKLNTDGEPIAITRNYVLGSQVRQFKSTHTNSVESLELCWHANCWAPQMRCIRVNHVDYGGNYPCHGCGTEAETRRTFQLTGTSPLPKRYVNDPSECGVNEYCIELE